MDAHFIRGAVQVPGNSERVTDADEEVFWLYSNLQATSKTDINNFRGLGYVDSRKDTMIIALELKPPDPVNKAITPVDTKKSSKKRHKRQKNHEEQGKTVEIKIAQDKTALRSRKGDTGSVLWRASIDFAQMVLQQIHNQSKKSLLNASVLKSQHIVELGAGTGFLAIALSSLVHRYTVTDVKEILPLIQKNVASNTDGCLRSNIVVEEIDWVLLQSTNPTQRPRVMNIDPVDLLLIVDCIYHPSLLPALVETIDYLTISDRTAVLVVIELRASDVTLEFLELWINKPNWEIFRINGMLDKPYTMWLGWRREITA